MRKESIPFIDLCNSGRFKMVQISPQPNIPQMRNGGWKCLLVKSFMQALYEKSECLDHCPEECVKTFGTEERHILSFAC